jgi:hypothetical protein
MTTSQNDRFTEHRLQTLEQAVSTLQKNASDLDRRMTVEEVNSNQLKESTKEFITRQEFTPIRMIVYGMAATALTGLLSAILSKIFV